MIGIWLLVIPSHVWAQAQTLTLQPGEIRVADVEGVSRVAVGKPDVVDVTVVSPTQLLLHAKAVGTTTLILWDQRGQQEWLLEVIDRASEATEGQVMQLIAELGIDGVRVKREGDKLFLLGQVADESDLERLEQMLTAFSPVTNLVRVVPPMVDSAATVPETPPMVSLAVQVIEMSRSDVEKLGVKWSESLGLTEPAATDLTFKDALVKWGTSLTRTSVATTLSALVQQNRARLLAEPKLVTASGKEASTFVGVEVPILQATTTGTGSATVTVNIEFKNTGVTLKMTPNVLADRRITTSMEAEVSDIDSSVALSVPVGSQTIAVPGFTVRKASTEVTTASGETVVIAGLLESDESLASSQVPALGSMPVFGRLFRSPEEKTSRRELVIAVTPALLDQEQVRLDEKFKAVEQALARADVTWPPPPHDPLAGYALQVQQRIASTLAYPTNHPIRAGELGMTGHVKLRLHLFRDGTLDQVSIIESSGLEAFDQAAMDTANAQAPYPMFPSTLARQDLWLEIPVLFRP